MKNFFIFVLFFVLVLFVQILGSFATDETVNTWYQTLALPSWTPPKGVFAPIWIVLYIGIALSGFLLWKRDKSENRSKALQFWSIQLIANGFWSFAFFYFKNPFLAAVDLTVVIIALAILMKYAAKISKIAFYLLIPYMIWLLYAFSLNWAIVYLN